MEICCTKQQQIISRSSSSGNGGVVQGWIKVAWELEKVEETWLRELRVRWLSWIYIFAQKEMKICYFIVFKCWQWWRWSGSEVGTKESGDNSYATPRTKCWKFFFDYTTSSSSLHANPRIEQNERFNVSWLHCKLEAKLKLVKNYKNPISFLIFTVEKFRIFRVESLWKKKLFTVDKWTLCNVSLN